VKESSRERVRAIIERNFHSSDQLLARALPHISEPILHQRWVSSPNSATQSLLPPARALPNLEHAFRLDTTTGELSEGINLFDDKPSPKDPGRVGQFNYCYMMDQDQQGNFLCTVPEASSIARADSEGKVRLIPTPTPHAYPRRGHRDDNNRFWFTEFFADKIAVIDLNTDEITEYPLEPRYISPYYARPDRTGKIWISSARSDRLMRLDPKTGKVVKYLMPVTYDARKVVADNSADRITVWLPNKNLGQLIRVEVED
jgi:hypothetical protein